MKHEWLVTSARVTGLTWQVNFELRFDVLNVFDNVNFLPHSTAANNNPGAGANIFTTDVAYRHFNNQFDPGGRLGQIMFRLNW